MDDDARHLTINGAPPRAAGSSRFSAGNESGGFGYVSLPGGGSVSYGPG